METVKRKKQFNDEQESEPGDQRSKMFKKTATDNIKGLPDKNAAALKDSFGGDLHITDKDSPGFPGFKNDHIFQDQKKKYFGVIKFLLEHYHSENMPVGSQSYYNIHLGTIISKLETNEDVKKYIHDILTGVKDPIEFDLLKKCFPTNLDLSILEGTIEQFKRGSDRREGKPTTHTRTGKEKVVIRENCNMPPAPEDCVEDKKPKITTFNVKDEVHAADVPIEFGNKGQEEATSKLRINLIKISEGNNFVNDISKPTEGTSNSRSGFPNTIPELLSNDKAEALLNSLVNKYKNKKNGTEKPLLLRKLQNVNSKTLKYYNLGPEGKHDIDESLKGPENIYTLPSFQNNIQELMGNYRDMEQNSFTPPAGFPSWYDQYYREKCKNDLFMLTELMKIQECTNYVMEKRADAVDRFLELVKDEENALKD